MNHSLQIRRLRKHESALKSLLIFLPAGEKRNKARKDLIKTSLKRKHLEFLLKPQRLLPL